MHKMIYRLIPILLFVIFMTSPATHAGPVLIINKIDIAITKQFDFENSVFEPELRLTSIEDGAIIPNNYCYPIFEWQTPDHGFCSLEFVTPRSRFKVFVQGERWQPEKDQFKQLLKEREIRITIYQLIDGKTLRSKTIQIHPAKSSIPDNIIYRVVDPLFNIARTNSIQMLRFGERQPEKLIEIEGSCLGCHTYGPGASLINVKKSTDRRLILAKNNSLEQKIIGEFSFFTISPDGRYAAVVGNAIGKIEIKPDFIEPFDLPYESGDIFIYDFKKNTLIPLNGASELDYIEDMPAFSPDGRWIIFVRYQFGNNGIKAMDLYQVPFNEGLGGTPVPIKNASSNNLYNYFPRFSPNGRWISFCRGYGDKGVFARKSSDIYLLIKKENRFVKLNFNKDGLMDSWHYWSSDSHWLVISSNRETNQLTSLYLVYVDENGKDYPPVKLVGYDKMKVNTPQFVSNHTNINSLKNIKGYIEQVYESFGGKDE